MTIIRKDSYTCYFVNSNTEKSFPTLDDARQAAEEYCGNASYAKPFPGENTFVYGPGDGTTSVLVRQDIEFTP